jgi:hypothetical protein
MNDHDPASSRETHSSPGQARPSGVRRLLSNRRSGWIVSGVLACAVIVLAVLLATSPSATPVPVVPGDQASNARSAPAAGGAAGAVDSMSASGFMMTTSAGQTVTVNQSSATTYQDGTGSIPANAITAGANVLVLGTTSGTTITATQVVVQPNDGGGSAASLAAGVIPFQRGAPATSKQDGQIPPDYSEGSGTIVSGSTANQATEAALAAYPGGVVDRVVQLSNGDYEVHYIGVNWPHHIFTDQTFKIMGAN